MSTTAAPAPQPPLSEAGRLTNVFFAPSRTFTDIRRNASWWLPWLIASIIAVAFAFTVDRRVTFEQAVQNEFQLMPSQAEKMDKMPAEQRDRVLHVQVVSRQVMSYAAPVGKLLLYVIFGALFMATFNFGLGAEVKFKQSMAIVAFASMPAVIKDILAMIAMWMPSFNPEGFLVQNPVATNAGAFLSERVGHMVLFSFLSGFDVFAIWSTILLGIGYAAVSKVKRSTAITVMFVWYAVLVLFGVGMAAIFS